MKNKIIKILIVIKNIILLIVGVFFALGSIIMITQDITATIFFGTVSVICIFFGKGIILEYLKKIRKNKIKKVQDEYNKEIENDLKIRQINFENEIAKKKMEIEYEKAISKLNLELKSYKVVEPSELEYKITIEKIQESYKELGFLVKVIDIRKNKYNTEYEVIFEQKRSQYEILLVSEKIKNEFSIDGINITGRKDKENHIIVSIPLEYKRV